MLCKTYVCYKTQAKLKNATQNVQSLKVLNSKKHL